MWCRWTVGGCMGCLCLLSISGIDGCWLTLPLGETFRLQLRFRCASGICSIHFCRRRWTQDLGFDFGPKCGWQQTLGRENTSAGWVINVYNRLNDFCAEAVGNLYLWWLSVDVDEKFRGNVDWEKWFFWEWVLAGCGLKEFVSLLLGLESWTMNFNKLRMGQEVHTIGWNRIEFGDWIRFLIVMKDLKSKIRLEKSWLDEHW